MLKYGRKIIKYFFKKWTAGDRLRHEYLPRVQADSHRSDIRVFEARLSAQRYGDNVQGTSDLAEEICMCLIATAKENNLFVPKERWDDFGDRKRLPSGESIVYYDADNKVVTKIKNPFAKAAIKNIRPSDIILEHIVHNILFPDTQYTFKGISQDLHELRIIYSQPYISQNFVPPTQKKIDKYLVESMGLIKEDAYFYGNDYIAITDVNEDSDNVLIDTKGKMYFIDPIIRFKKPVPEVIDYYYQFLK